MSSISKPRAVVMAVQAQNASYTSPWPHPKTLWQGPWGTSLRSDAGRQIDLIGWIVLSDSTEYWRLFQGRLLHRRDNGTPSRSIFAQWMAVSRQGNGRIVQCPPHIVRLRLFSQARSLCGPDAHFRESSRDSGLRAERSVRYL